jgi:TRAP-type C4-dicarboxylate transport system permease small subunit
VFELSNQQGAARFTMSKILHKTIWAIERVTLAGGGLAAILMACIALLMLAEIFMRSFVGVALSFSWEYSAYFMATVFFLGSAYALRVGGHVRVALLLEQLPPPFDRILEVISTLIGLLISGYAAIAASNLALLSFERGTTSFTPTRTLLFIPQSLVALGLIMLSAQFIARLLRFAAGLPLDPGALQNDAARDQ